MGILWTSQQVDLSANENYDTWFRVINPRSMVPVLVLDGTVHINSNDTIATLEEAFPSSALWPTSRVAEIRAGLTAENALHHDGWWPARHQKGQGTGVIRNSRRRGATVYTVPGRGVAAPIRLQ